MLATIFPVALWIVVSVATLFVAVVVFGLDLRWSTAPLARAFVA